MWQCSAWLWRSFCLQNGRRRRVIVGSGGSAFVVMMQTSQFANLDHATFVGSLCSSPLWSVFAERQMSAPVMVGIRISGQVATQRPLTEYDHMIQALTANRADQPFDVGSLPRGPRCRQHLLNPLRFHLVHELLAEDLV